MKNHKTASKYLLGGIVVFCCSLLVSNFFFIPNSNASSNLATRLNGRILLQVERKGEAWYVNPVNEKRYYLGRPWDAWNLMRKLGLGVSEVNYNSYKNNKYTAPTRLSGKIILRVEANGEAYYINPIDLKLNYLGRPSDAFAVMRRLGLGITETDLNKISIMSGYNNPSPSTGPNVATCTDECSTKGEGRCQNNQAYSCGQHDSDSCLEWGTDTCQSNQICYENDMTLYKTAACYTKAPCHEPHYTMAFILLEREQDKATPEEIARVKELKDMFPVKFSEATRGLATMDTSYPVQVIDLEDPSSQEPVNIFLEKNPDTFDFVTMYSTYDIYDSAYHGTVQNNIAGIGITIDAPDLNHPSSIKSKKLLGFNWMKNIERTMPEFWYSESQITPEVIDSSNFGNMNAILHETAHQWSAYMRFIDENGQKSYALQVREKNPHWSTAINERSVLGGGVWIDNKNGTFSLKTRSTPEDFKENLSKLDLYAMGLISPKDVGSIELLTIDDLSLIAQGNGTVTAQKKLITIDQIITAEGERVCVDNELKN